MSEEKGTPKGIDTQTSGKEQEYATRGSSAVWPPDLTERTDQLMQRVAEEKRVDRIMREILQAAGEDPDEYMETEWGPFTRANAYSFTRLTLRGLLGNMPVPPPDDWGGLEPSDEAIEHVVYEAVKLAVLSQLRYKQTGLADLEERKAEAQIQAEQWADGLDPEEFKDMALELWKELHDRTPEQVMEYRSLLDADTESWHVLRVWAISYYQISFLHDIVGLDRFEEADRRYAELERQLEEERQKREEAERELKEERRRAQYASPTSMDVVSPLFSLGLTRESIEPKVTKGKRQLRTYLTIPQPGSKAEVQLTLFGDQDEEQLRQIDRDVKNTLSPYGLKLIYLVMRECFHNGMQPWFRLDTNRCLDAMNYRRQKDGSHYSRNRDRFHQELRRLSENVWLNVEKRSPKNAHFDAAVVFRGPLVKITGAVENWDDIPKGESREKGKKIAEDAVILVEPQVYRYVTEGWYTWIPERFLTVDPQKHGHAILLIAYCETQFKIGGSQYQGIISQPLRQILALSGLIYEYEKISRADRRERFIGRVWEELDWMTDEEYIKGYGREGDRANPLDWRVTITIPDEHRLVQEWAEGRSLLPKTGGVDGGEELTPERIRKIRGRYGLTQAQFAAELGVSRRTIAGVEAQQRAVSKKLRGQITEFLYRKRAH